MKLVVNGAHIERDDSPATIADLLATRGDGAQVAVAVDGIFVPRSRHATTPLRDGMQIEIVAPMQGG